MKIYTEVVYTWDDEKNELVKESEKSFDYEGELVQCIKIGGYSWKPPKVNIKPPTITIPDIPVPDIPTPDLTSLTENPLTTGLNNTVGEVAGGISGAIADNTGSINTAGETLGRNLGAGASLLTSGLSSAGDTLGDGMSYLRRQGDKLAQLGKEAISGKGGYADDAGPGPDGPGPTGSEDATAGRTLLTGIRKKGSGRSAHVSSGTASSVS